MANSALQDIFNGVGNAFHNVGSFVNNEVQQFTPAVQNFAKQAAPFIENPQQAIFNIGPQQIGQGLIGFGKPVQQFAQNAASYFDPNSQQAAQGNGFWQQPVGKMLAGEQQLPQLHPFSSTTYEGFNKMAGGGMPGQVAGTIASLPANLLEGIINAPAQAAQGEINQFRDMQTGQMTPQHTLANLGQSGEGVLTMATLGEGAAGESFLKELAGDTWQTGLLKGLIKAVPVGGAFGLSAGLQQNKDANSVQDQLVKSLPQVGMGMLAAGVLSTVLGPIGKLFFGGQPGETAALAEKGLVPNEVMQDAYRILNVEPGADLNTIRQAYRQAAVEFHPDRGGTNETMAMINNAYEALTANHAPTITTVGGQETPMWSEKYGGDVTPEQQAAAEKAPAQNEAFQQEIKNLQQNNRFTSDLPQTKVDPALLNPTEADLQSGLAMLKRDIPQATTPEISNQDLALKQLPQLQTPEATAPNLSDQELGQIQLRQQNPALQYPEMQTQHLQGLTQMKDGLQAQIKTEPPQPQELQGLIKMKTGLQEEIDQAQSILKNKDLYQQRYGEMVKPSEIRAHIRDLKTSIKNLDGQTKDMEGKVKLAMEEKNARIKTQLDDINKQIDEEQARLRVNTVMDEAKKQAIISKSEPDITSPDGVTAQPSAQLSPQQQSFQTGTSINDITGDINAPKPRVTLEAPPERGTVEAKTAAGLPAPKISTETASPQTGKVKIQPVRSVINDLLLPEREMLQKSKDQDIRLLEQKTTDAEHNHADMKNKAQTALEDVRKLLTPDEYANAVDYVEGKAAPMNADVQKWGDTWKQVRDDIAAKSKAVNLQIKDPETGDYRPFELQPDYFPHAFQKDVLDQYRNNDQVLQQMVTDGKAPNIETARSMLNKTVDHVQSRKYGHLEISRTDNGVPYIKDPRVAEDYVDNAYKRIAFANQFGPNNSEATSLINAAASRGNIQDADAAKTFFDREMNLNNPTVQQQGARKLSSLIRTGESLSKLGFVALHHAGQIASIAGRSGAWNMIKNTPQAAMSLLTDEQSPFARQAVSELHNDFNGYDTHINSGDITEKFLSAVGFNRAIKTLRALGADAAHSQAQSMLGDLNNPTNIRLLQKAGINAQDVATRGSFTQEELNRYARTALDDTSLIFKNGDLPASWNTPLGRMLTMFKSFGYKQATKTVPFMLSEFSRGNVGPLLAFVTLGTGIGVSEQLVQNLMTNKPAETPGKLLIGGALRGANPGLVGDTIASYAQYPQYATSNTIGLLGGPVASDLYNGYKGLQALQGGTDNDKLTAERTALRSIPLVGAAAANTLAPYNSYIGNRPSDVISAMSSGKDITHGFTKDPTTGETIPSDFSYKTTPSTMDLLRQNPTVTANDQKVQKIVDTKKAITSSLDTNQQGILDTANNLLQKSFKMGDPKSKMDAYQLLLGDPGVLHAKSMSEVVNGQINGTPTNPIWSIGLANPDAQKALMQYNAMIPGPDKKQWAKDHADILNGYHAAMADYSTQLEAAGKANQERSGIVAPAPSKRVSGLLDQAKQTKNYSLYDDPEVKQYFDQLDYYDTYVRSQYGLDGSGQSSGGSSSSYGKGSSNYLKNQLLYAIQNTNMQKAQLAKLTSGSKADGVHVDPLQAYSKAQSNLIKLLQSAPQLDNAPKLQSPQVKDGQIDIKLPTQGNQKEGFGSPGRIMTQLR